MDASSLLPEEAADDEEFARVLRALRALADLPYRELERLTSLNGEQIPGTTVRRVPLRRSTLVDVLSGRKFPRKAFLLTFVEACGVDLRVDHRWERAWHMLVQRREHQTNECTEHVPPSEPTGADQWPMARRIIQLASADVRLMARVLEHMNSAEIAAIAELAESEPVAVELFEHMHPSAAGAALSPAPAATCARLLRRMSPENAARLLTALPPATAGRTLRCLTAADGWHDEASRRVWTQTTRTVLGGSDTQHRAVPSGRSLVVDIAACVLVVDEHLLRSVRHGLSSLPHRVRRQLQDTGTPVESLRVRLVGPRQSAAQGSSGTPFYTLPSEQQLWQKAVQELRGIRGSDIVGTSLTLLDEAVRSRWDIEHATNARHVVWVYSDVIDDVGRRYGPQQSPVPTSTVDKLSKVWEHGMPGHPFWHDTKRCVLMAPDGQPWNTLTNAWGMLVHYASPVGTGIQEFEMQQVLEALTSDV
ncbi:magnesium transporter MgtE N-terminal domain-containing protein [Streptomyces sp. NPDC057403]|uniref:magnesium transporter MgtE N-terminal domain-containing protein n=1 Tax=Streptomyces sp. NPDC057403 TaxID=3346119 RepID=UPI00369A2866